MATHPSDDEKADLLAQLQRYIDVEKKIFRLLAENRFEELERLGDGNGLTGQEIEEAFDPEQWPETTVGSRGMRANRSISISTVGGLHTVKVRRMPFDGSWSSPTLCYTISEEQNSKAIINIKSIGGRSRDGSA